MRVVLCVIVLVSATMAQRSPYAPRPVGYPDVLNRFNTDTNGDLPTRIDGDNKDQGPLQTPQGSIGDPYLLNRVNEWPQDKKPFWYLNMQHIMDHRGQRNPNTQANGQGQANRQGQGQGQGQANRQGQGQANRQGQGQTSQLGQGLAPQGQANRQSQWNRQQ